MVILRRYRMFASRFLMSMGLMAAMAVSAAMSDGSAVVQGQSLEGSSDLFRTLSVSFAVSKTADTNDGVCDADCSLREAIIASNASPGTDTINLPAGTFTLTIAGASEDASATGDLDVTDGLNIIGNTAATTIINGNGLVTGDRVFHILSGAPVEISRVTVQGGKAPAASNGGGIQNNGSQLTVEEAIVTNNTAGVSGDAIGARGGGINNGSGSTLVVDDTTFTNNNAIRNGGGMAINGSATITNSIFTGNTANQAGGIATGGILTIEDSIISGNSATGGDAGGITVESAATATISDAVVSGNTAVGAGGGIKSGGDLTLEDSEVTGNSATSGGGILLSLNTGCGCSTITNTTISGNTAEVSGGGIYFSDGSTSAVTASTISANSAGSLGGGVTISSGSIADIKSTILANNVSPTGPDCNGTFSSLGYNLVENLSSCSGAVGTDITGADPVLGPLADNGGHTMTHALLPGSPAIDAVPVANCTDASGDPLDEDQRGAIRPVDGNGDGISKCDVGSYEAPLTIESSVAIALSPSEATIEPGGTADMDIIVDSASQSLDAVEVEVLYDPDIVQVVDSDPTTSGVQIAPGTIFGTTLLNEVVLDTITGDQVGIIRFAQGLGTGASLTLEPSSGPPGTVVTASGTGYDPDAEISLMFDGAEVAAEMPELDGSMSIAFTVPTATTGVHTVAARQEGVAVASRAFTVTAPSLQAPPSGSFVLGTITFEGVALGSSSIHFSFAEAAHGGLTVPTVISDALVTVPEPSVLGITLDPQVGGVGTPILVTGTAWGPGQEVTVSWPSPAGALCAGIPNLAGVFTCSGEVPSGAAFGTHIVTASDGLNGATATFQVGVIIRIDPADTTAAANETFAVDILIRSGAQQFDSADASLNFDATMLQVVDDDPAKDGVQITGNTALDIEFANDADNTAGTIAYAAGTFGTPKSGDFVLATVHFTAIGPADATTAITWVHLPDRPTKVNLGATNVLLAMEGGSVTITETAMKGKVSFLGRPSAPHERLISPVKVTFYPSGSTTPVVDPVDGTTTDTGEFTLAGVPGLAPGTYDIRVKRPNSMAMQCPNVDLTLGLQLHFGTFKEGDANDSGFVDTTDFGILKNGFRRAPTHPLYDLRPDFDNNLFVDTTDFGLLKGGFRLTAPRTPTNDTSVVCAMLPSMTAAKSKVASALKEGSQSWGPQSTAADEKFRTQSSSSQVSIGIQPAIKTASLNEVFEVNIIVSAGAQQVDSADVSLRFDPSVLRVVGPDSAEATRVVGGSQLPEELMNQVDNNAGTIAYSAGHLTGTASGEIILATVRFKALAASNTTSINWVNAQFSPTKVNLGPENVLGAMNDGRVSIIALIPGGGVPAPPRLLGPVGGTELTGLGPLLRWEQPSGTTQFHIRVTPYNDDGPGINLIIADAALAAGSGYQIQAPAMDRMTNFVMLPGMGYKWQVRVATARQALAESDSGWGEWSYGEFRTPIATSTTITSVLPAPGEPVTTLTPVLRWENRDPTIFYYEVQISKDPGFNLDPATATAMVYWELRHGGVTAPPNSYAVPSEFPLESRTAYYWRVRPRVQGDGAAVDWSTIWSFISP